MISDVNKVDARIDSPIEMYGNMNWVVFLKMKFYLQPRYT